METIEKPVSAFESDINAFAKQFGDEYGFKGSYPYDKGCFFYKKVFNPEDIERPHIFILQEFENNKDAAIDTRTKGWHPEPTKSERESDAILSMFDVEETGNYNKISVNILYEAIITAYGHAKLTQPAWVLRELNKVLEHVKKQRK